MQNTSALSILRYAESKSVEYMFGGIEPQNRNEPPVDCALHALSCFDYLSTAVSLDRGQLQSLNHEDFAMSESFELSLTQRLESLEQENRRLARDARLLKRFGGLVLLGVVVAASAGANLADLPVIEAQRILIKDQRTGKVRFDIGTNINDGRGNFMFLDQNGRTRINITTSDEGFVGIHFIGPDGNVTKAIP